ncbi:hypothetical protein N8I77_000219 [Diaporthe amygdali]|uniref:non-specific serine/threonine protein kinase n=1 Tax=Phomopsis amygdali TaxID=1214568 RepID=A0AAD9SLS2_PHOAM|nr:hypothetical protein N8I77_000219 [Diaporthe amygdali]
MASILRRLLRSSRRYKAETDKKSTTAVDESSLAKPSTTLVAAHQTKAAQSPSMASNSSQRPPSPARVFPTSGFHEFSKSHKVDEENYSWYSPKEFYPIRIGEVIQDRYQVITKLGYGTASTSWLCRDLNGHQYVAIKVYASNQEQAQREIAAFKHLRKVLGDGSDAKELGGAQFIRLLHRSFELSHPKSSKKNLCLVYEPMGMTLADLRKIACEGQIPLELLKPMLPFILAALDFMHTKANMVHTDIQEGNIMFSIEDEAELKAVEEEEIAEPSARKIQKDNAVFMTRQVLAEVGNPKLIDLGEARFGQDKYAEHVMPDLYRAPEILLGLSWDSKIDIWALGLMIWTAVEGENLFTDNNGGRWKSALPHMARMVSLLGPPPQSLLDRSEETKEFFDKNGQLKKGQKLVETSLEEEENVLEGEEKTEFLRFIRCMLQWDPADRPSAAELVNDPFLHTDPDEDEDEEEGGE